MSAGVLRVPGVGYPVAVGAGPQAHACIAEAVRGREMLIVTDANVAPLHLAAVRRRLAGARSEALVLDPGERAKSPEGFMRVIDALAAGRFHRDALVVALGGGVVGDLAGFAAACYQRGVDWLAVPTTLLAQVDAALGGKTAINHPRAKNLIGAFHDPVAVWTDTGFLDTLPAREYRAGLAEVVKYGLAFDREFLDWLGAETDALAARDRATLEEMVTRSTRFKLEVVATDRREQGRRALLNLGHTLGHAVETALGHGTWLHGEAVAVGLVAAARLSAARGRLDSGFVLRLVRLLERFGLPTALPQGIDEARLNSALALDKKIAAGRLRFIGLAAPGRAEIWDDVDAAELAAAIAACRAG